VAVAVCVAIDVGVAVGVDVEGGTPRQVIGTIR